jgi:hypothetical protein
LKPSFDIQERNGYSLPPNHTPSVLPLRSVGFLMPVSARQVMGRRHVRPAGVDRHVEAGVLVVALVLGDVIAGELRLGDPFELDRHLVGRVSGG